MRTDGSRQMVVRGAVYTMDPRRPRAEALGVAAGRVVAVGGVDEARAAVGDDAPLLDLGSATILPGLIDSHNHMLWTGMATQLVDLSPARDVRGLLDAVAGWAAAHPDAEWVVGAEGWELYEIAERRHPNRAELDRICPDRPVYLGRGGHSAAVNSRALQLAGIDRDTPQPAGGVIERDGDGEPTGVLLEGPARELVRALIPPPTAAQRRAALAAIQPRYVAAGLTRVMEPGLEPDELALYQELREAGDLRLRVTAMPMLGQSPDAPDRLRAVQGPGVRTGFGDEWLRLGPAKLFLDGGASHGTALLREPYPDRPDYRGELVTSEQDLEAIARACARGGWSLAIHAVGGGAIDLALDVFERVNGELEIAPLRFSLIHSYIWPEPRDMERARRLGVVMAIQPTMQERFAAGLASRFGWPAIARATPLRAWHDAGVVVAGGSDSPITPFQPLRGIWQAVTRHLDALGEPLGPEQCVTAEQALAMYTVNAAHACFEDGASGVLREGARADWIALPEDPTRCDAANLRDLAPLVTAVGGELVHDSR